MKGYKIFDSQLKCRNFQYEIGKEYKHNGEFKICNSGFHFCVDPVHCFSYYDFKPTNIVCEVEALGETQTHSDDSKVATNHIKIIRQLTWDEVLKICNKGENNLGYGNAGYSNAGYSNAGNDNAGNYNAGNHNAGNDNAGNDNAGNRNAGNYNAGNHNAGNDNAGYSNAGNDNAGNDNAGNRNAGNYNAGNRNAGNYNAGNYNAGNDNAGNRNAGNYNAGNDNAGNRNAGNDNAGNRNAGNYNAGNRNAGYSNAGNDNAGAFNISTKYKMFDKETNWTYEDFTKSKAFDLLHTIDTTLWVPSSSMSNEEKENYPYHVTTGGYYRQIPYKEAFVNKWNNWSKESRKAFTSLPNFDWKIFTEITGVIKP